MDSVPTIHIQDLGDPGPGWGSGPGRGLGEGRSSSHDSLLLLSSSSSSCGDWLSPPGAAWTSSTEDLDRLRGGAGGVRVAKDNSLLSLMHRSEQKTTTPWHHSTGHLLEDGGPRAAGRLLDNQEEAGLSDGSASPLLLRKRSAASRRVSSRLRSRKCLSLGAGLDLPFPGEEEEARGRGGGGGGGGGGGASARHHRLHLLAASSPLRYTLSSSSLSSSGSTPPRCPSVADLTEGRSTEEALDSSYSPRQVSLESREHAWLVKSAAGAWTEVYSLFREDPSLLQRPDFVSGFTVLHWIAKHGDHRVLNTLWYGVSKAGARLPVDARSWSGYTPLHLAALHGHRKMMRLLVNKFHADVRIRDAAGKRAWQYLEDPPPLDLMHLLGAPCHAHPFPEDGPRRPPPRASAGVKRSTSIAAFLKHKSLLRLRDLADVTV
ncbi:unnamed protein product [Merluccius merluccius]